ncbi:M20/M25/M40 family metallo-hydrolase [Devriesea agamarum]|uniref:M20/M25/M40 family metallo-hydrolase n=1 Tax=Devriesea agamarum TaxID=472569 RepID=UPI00071E3CFB|nr:M20/M25/M40 family metallo-hydrolase [Devriesea agamarum]
MSTTPTPAAASNTVHDVVKALVALDTTSALGNRPAIELLAELFGAAGAQVRTFAEQDEVRVNLLATFPAQDGSTDGGILLAGHADCVPVTGQNWSSDPFSPEVRDGKLYGRGTADMKSYLGIAAALAPRFAAATLREPIHIAATWDEETNCNGARALVKQLDEVGIHPRIAFVGEPTSMRAVSAHKSMNVLHAHFRGIAAHSSLLPRGLNAIRYAARFTDWFHTEIIDSFRLNGPYDEAFPVAWSTGGVNVFHGGIACNTVPDTVDLELEFRALPHVEVEPIVDRILAKIHELDVEMKDAIPADPTSATDQVGASIDIVSLLYGLDGGPDSEAARYAVQLGAIPCEEKVTYGTEAGIYEHAGMSVVVVGPGDISQAHAADEFVTLEQLEACEAFFDALIADLSDDKPSR